MHSDLSFTRDAYSNNMIRKHKEMLLHLYAKYAVSQNFDHIIKYELGPK